jgi:hypothetical protein
MYSSLESGTWPCRRRQFPLDFGDSLQALFQLVAVADPTADPLQQMEWRDRPCCVASPQGYDQLAGRAMVFAALPALL